MAATSYHLPHRSSQSSMRPPTADSSSPALTGIVLPNIHLGSFSRMTIDFDSPSGDSRYPQPAPAPTVNRQSSPPGFSTSSRTLNSMSGRSGGSGADRNGISRSPSGSGSGGSIGFSGRPWSSSPIVEELPVRGNYNGGTYAVSPSAGPGKPLSSDPVHTRMLPTPPNPNGQPLQDSDSSPSSGTTGTGTGTGTGVETDSRSSNLVGQPQPPLPSPPTHKPSLSLSVPTQPTQHASFPSSAKSDDNRPILLQEPVRHTPKIFAALNQQVPSSQQFASTSSGSPGSPRNAAPPIYPPPSSGLPQTPQRPQQVQQPYPSNFPKYASAPRPMPEPKIAAIIPAAGEEVCIECMMRDRDMADVDVTGPGVWERDSDVWFEELKRRDKEEEEEERKMGLSDLQRRRKKSMGNAALTEENMVIWLAKNPKEPQARWLTLQSYVKSQAALLEAESVAREQAARESQHLSNIMRDTYSQLRQSAYEVGAITIGAGGNDDSLGVNGVRIKPPPAHGRSWDDEEATKREMTLLENGLVMERVDVKRERSRKKKEEKRRSRKMSRASATSGGGDIDAASIYSAPGANTTPYGQATIFNSPVSMLPSSPSQPSLLPSASASTPSSRRLSSPLTGGTGTSPTRPGMVHRNSQHGSVESKGRARFFAHKYWSGNYGVGGNGSEVSFVNSGSMMDMHLGIAQDRHASLPPLPVSPPQARHPQHNQSLDLRGDNNYFQVEPWQHSGFPSAPPVMENDKEMGVWHEDANNRDAKKKGSLGKLWKRLTGGGQAAGGKGSPTIQTTQPRQGHHQQYTTADDEYEELTPPPPLSYLVSRSTGSGDSHHIRHATSPPGPPTPNSPASMGSMPASPTPHLRSASAPMSASGSPLPTANSMPSPMSNRFPFRDGGDSTNVNYNLQPNHIDMEIANANANDRRAPSVRSASTGFSGGLLSPPSPRPMDTRSMRSSSSTPNTVIAPSILQKALPPLPTEAFGAPIPRPKRVFPPSPESLLTPLRNSASDVDIRRQSYGGVTAKKAEIPFEARSQRDARNSNFYATLPPLLPPPRIGARYDEFGASNHSLGNYVTSSMNGTTPKKRGSRFGLSSLFGKKDKETPHKRVSEGNAPPPDMTYSQWRPESPSMHYPQFSNTMTLSRSSLHEPAGPPRRNLSGLIVQDDDFVAYRYPSGDQPLDLLRH